MKKIAIKFLKFILAVPAMLSVASLMCWLVSIIFAGPIMIPLMAVINWGYGFDYAGLGMFLLLALGWVAFSLLGTFLDEVLYESPDEMYWYATANFVVVFAVFFLWVNGLP